MRDFKEITKDDVIGCLKDGKEVRAVIFSCISHINKGGDHIKEGVYPLNSRMSIADIARYEREDNVAFFVHEEGEGNV